MTEHVGRSTTIEGVPDRSRGGESGTVEGTDLCADERADSCDGTGAALVDESDRFERRLQERVDRVVEAELAEAIAAMEATEGSLSPAKRQLLETLARRLAEQAVAPARQGLAADDPTVRAHTAALFDLD